MPLTADKDFDFVQSIQSKHVHQIQGQFMKGNTSFSSANSTTIGSLQKSLIHLSNQSAIIQQYLYIVESCIHL